ncbi:GntR family transcriptional regulator [Sphingobacterium alkalisoli]|uniref:GntR family transcriptional regulator n=1 Tax=Sphingobacterium alkalisoli TaxID=1874115 RepID=A0A4U0GXQ9_9SPHI|nr:GntR family transcriptional regulator [Sphingobacterium alkalisoli]TJY63981.1 GntR family transcriptional regulator [Sphingobacterium alkalisoli]GGH23652.1 GntR family transcriptional regulator [Sphingobacterium alkalisoli]
MDFNNNKAIYLQIVEHVCEHILLGTWKPEEKIPSVRDMAVSVEVNPNTVARTYELLQQKGIINNKRGVGFFLSTDAIQQVQSYRKAAFIDDELPQVFKNMYLLEVTTEDIRRMYEAFIKQNFNTK